MATPVANVVLVTGKGGVGKTTVAAGLALCEAQARGGAVLLEFGDGDAGRRALGASSKRVVHVVVDPRDALVSVATPMLGSAFLAKAVLGNFAVSRFVRAAPAVHEVALLESVRLAAEQHGGRRVFVDMPATGHGVAWLRAPAQLRDVASSGPVYEVTRRLCDELIAPGRVSLVVVTLPERLVLVETLELWTRIRDEVGLEAARLVINRFPVELDARALADARIAVERGGDLAPSARRLVLALEARAAAFEEARRVLEEALAATGAQPLVLPEHPDDPDVRDVATALAKGLS